MEETLGKRIVTHRKRLGLTQDRLADLLGVTAQAVSKWENDQACPDIAMLPKLAEVFGITTDELLGLGQKERSAADAAPAQPESDSQEPDGLHVQKGNWEFTWDGGRRGSLFFALWVLLCGGLLLTAKLLEQEVGLWDIMWTTALLTIGLSGLFPRFSFFSLACALFGGYCLLSSFQVLPIALGKELLLPIFLLLFGLSLLGKALRKPAKPTFHYRKGSSRSSKHDCRYTDEGFDCSVSFAENRQLICLPRLSRGSANVSFGELTVDLSGCEEFADDCRLKLNCSFGELEVLIPRGCRVEPATSTAFANVEITGHPTPDAATVIRMECSASFGEISIRYL